MQPDIAALVSSRICHDLISPIGAISNGVELLQLTDGGSQAEMDLIRESVESASARIRFFRLAYGAFTDDNMIGRSDILSILSANARGGRVNYIWQITGDQPRSMVQAGFLMLQALETTLPLGGDIRAHQDGDDWVMQAEGNRITFDHVLWDNVLNPDPGFVHSAAQVQFALLPKVLEPLHRQIRITPEPQRVSVRF